MPIYRIHFKNHGGHYFSTEYFDSQSDEEAVVRAHQLHVPSIGHGFELWQEDRLVHSHPEMPKK